MIRVARRLLLGLLFSLGTSAFAANAVPARWSAYFDGGISMAPGSRGWSSFLKFDHHQCDAWASPMDQLVRDYDIAVYQGQVTQADNLYSRIQAILFSELGESHPCFQAAAYAYVVNALFWIDNLPFGYQSLARSGEINRAKALLFSALINHGKVALLTPSLREKRMGIWAETADRGTPRVLGTFECATSSITVDLLQRPLDEAATVAHELDHFVRDKVLSVEYAGSMRRAPVGIGGIRPGDADWPSFLLSDETLASSYGVALQLRYRLSPVFQEPVNDLSFSSDRGPIWKIWSANANCLQNTTLRGLLTALSPGGWRGCVDSGFSAKDSEYEMPAQPNYADRGQIFRELQRAATDVRNMVQGAYFSRRSPVPAATIKLLAITEWSPLATWEGVGNYASLSNYASLEPGLDWNDLIRSEEDFSGQELGAGALNNLREILELDNRETSVCRSYQAHLGAIARSGYLAAALSPGIRVSDKGVKGDSASRLDQGLRGADKGVKGDDGTLRLCVDFEHKM